MVVVVDEGVHPPSLRRELGSESRPRHVQNHRLVAQLLANVVNDACRKRVEECGPSGSVEKNTYNR